MTADLTKSGLPGWWGWGVVVLAVFLVVPPVHPAELPPSGTLSGTIVDPDGKPVAAVRIWYEPRTLRTGQRPESIATATDAAGRFRIGPLEPEYTGSRSHLFASSAQYPVQAIAWDGPTLRPGSDRDLGVIRLDRGRVYRGTVLDTDGTPRVGAKVDVSVRYHYMGHTVADLIPKVQMTTDAAGRFHTAPLPLGHLALAIREPGRLLASISRPIDLPGEEDLGAIRLIPGLSVAGVVRDEAGQPLADVQIGGNVPANTTTDARGAFMLHGFASHTTFSVFASKPGFVQSTARATVTADGVDLANDAAGPTPELVMTLKRAGTIEGMAVDADSGAPVRLARVVVREIQRGVDGSIGISSRSEPFPQTELGRFHAEYPEPGEYRLTFSAPGYQDTEIDVTGTAPLGSTTGVVARIKRDGIAPATPPAPTARQSLTGTITRDGRPVPLAWVRYWVVRRPTNPVNAPVLRGRMVVAAPGSSPFAAVRDGLYTLGVSTPGTEIDVVVDEPGHALTVVGPIVMDSGETKKLDIDCTAGGKIRGQVAGVPEGWEGFGWVVAFGRTGVRVEARLDRDGRFTLPSLPPGEYGLKVGHEAYEDAEVYPGLNARLHPEAFNLVADPWKQARIVTVEAGRDRDGVEIDWPE